MKLKEAIRLDGWKNLLTGWGVLGKDKRLSSEIQWKPLVEADAEHLYAQSDIAKKIVNKVPEEGLREGFKLKGVSIKQADLIIAKYNEIHAEHKLEEAWKWGRLYGGAGALMVTDNMSDLTQPMEIEDVKQIFSLTILNRWQLVPDFSSLQKDISLPNFGYPTIFRIQSRMGGVPQEVHISRFLKFDGNELPTRLRMTNHYWHDSILTQVYTPILNYDSSHDSIAQVIQDFRVGIFKMKNLTDMIAEDKSELITLRLQLANMSKSILNAMVLDAESEDFSHQSTNVAGLKDLIEKIEARLASAAEMPRTVIFGESPAGMGGSGRHEQQNFYDDVSVEQNVYLKPRHLHLLKVIANTLGINHSKLDIEYNPLYQLDEAEEAAVRKTNAEADNLYVNNGTLDPREVAISRFGGDNYGHDIQIDLSLDRTPQPDPALAAPVPGVKPKSTPATAPIPKGKPNADKT